MRIADLVFCQAGLLHAAPPPRPLLPIQDETARRRSVAEVSPDCQPRTEQNRMFSADSCPARGPTLVLSWRLAAMRSAEVRYLPQACIAFQMFRIQMCLNSRRTEKWQVPRPGRWLCTVAHKRRNGKGRDEVASKKRAGPISPDSSCEGAIKTRCMRAGRAECRVQGAGRAQGAEGSVHPRHRSKPPGTCPTLPQRDEKVPFLLGTKSSSWAET